MMMFRTLLQELCQQRRWAPPVYIVDAEGPPHMLRFDATVAVNGVQFPPPDEGAKTVKEAKELAAKVAFEHFSALLRPPPPRKPELDSPTSVEDPKLTLPRGCPPSNNKRQRNNTPALETQHLYKSQLQIYAQKRHIALPLYHTSQIGSPQAMLFKSTVSIDGRTFESTQEYRTAKEEEFGAAKVALLLLPQESKPRKKIKAGSTSGLSFSGIKVNCKTQLQTYAQKNGKQLPSYHSIQYGPPHALQFKSIVTIDGKTFQSPQWYHTIREAESAAANAAIMSLTQEASS